jgi:aspartyl aminopeptidase
MTSSAPAETRDLLAYIDASPTSWHCVAETARRLDALGFEALDEAGPWSVAPGKAYYIARGGALIALRVGTRAPWEAGFRIIGAHTDSPHLRLKPQPDVAKSSVRQLGVEVYGGAIWYSWLDRDLGVAGRVFVRREGGAEPEARLFAIRAPICRIPSVAIHLNREVNSGGLKLNAQQHLAPMFAMESDDIDFRRLVADAAGVAPEAVVGWDAALFDAVPSAFGGWNDAFVFAPRLDNQASCHAALAALSGTAATETTQVIALHDHEEVGSLSREGADGPFLETVLRRLSRPEIWGTTTTSDDHTERFARATALSWHVSADMAHASHPNYADLHEPQHKPLLGGGPVIKINSNQRYATSGEGEALFSELAAAAGVPVQRFVTRTDLACGTTIGPIAAARLGIRTVDVGNPMLSMHAIREQCASADHPRMIAVLARFLAG